MAKSTEHLRALEGERAYTLVQATISAGTQRQHTNQRVLGHFLTFCAAYLAMISGRISRMLEGRALRFLGRPTRPGGKEMVSPCSKTLLALPMVALTPVLASPKPVLAIFFTPSYRRRTELQAASVSYTCWLCRWRHSPQCWPAQSQFWQSSSPLPAHRAHNCTQHCHLTLVSCVNGCTDARPKPILAIFFTPSYTQRTQLHPASSSYTC